jgi:hypothetical protein
VCKSIPHNRKLVHSPHCENLRNYTIGPILFCRLELPALERMDREQIQVELRSAKHDPRLVLTPPTVAECAS